ncbi:MAG TPA: response regulator [Candidatus Competibacteraceae bacterium]|nr:response regulator [Candidatus Competibacteraceae bacterium]
MMIQKALVVDDSKVAHLTLRKMLTERGIQVDWVDSGEAGIDYLRRQRPDVVFMDVMMPGMDGFETSGVITRDPSIDAPPIIMCSANATEQDQQQARSNGAVAFLSKPYTPDELDQVLSRVSQLSKAPAATQPQPPVAPAAPAAAPAPAAALPELAVLRQELTALAEQTARAVAGETARGIAQEVAEAIAARTASQTVADAEPVTKEMARDAARGTARSVAEDSARAVASTLARQVAEEVARSIAQELVQGLGAQLQRQLAERAVPQIDSAALKNELLHELKDGVARRVDQALAPILAGDALQQRLRQLLQAELAGLQESTGHSAEQLRDSTVLAAKEAAHAAAALAVQERLDQLRPDAALAAVQKRANLALGVGLLAVVVAVLAGVLF